MPTFTVIAAHKTKDVEGQYGAMKDVALVLKDDQGMEHQASWFTKARTPIPEIGSTVDGTLEPGKFGPKFKKAAPANGFQPRGKSPEEQAQIRRMASQKAAVKAVELALTAGVMSVSSSKDLFDALRKTADWFDSDTRKAGGQ